VTFRAACIQLRSGVAIAPNIAEACDRIREAEGNGADLILTPENTSTISLLKSDLQHDERGESNHPAVAAFSALADELSTWLLIGSIGIEVGEERYANRSYLFDPAGAKVVSYDKIHMFDVAVSKAETWRESDTYEAGDRAVVADLPWGKIGLSICYDLRFPHLYRALANAGADFLTVPAAFTQPTGAAHWHTLLRARAIESGAYVFAPAQGGTHDNGRKTYGHSLIIGPWGEIIAEAGEDPTILYADIDPDQVREARRRLPSLEHDRPFQTP